MTPSTQGKAAVHSPKLTAALQVEYPARRGEQSQCATGSDLLEGLQEQFTALGLSLFSVNGRELAVTATGVQTRAMPDARCAWLYLRQVRGQA